MKSHPCHLPMTLSVIQGLSLTISHNHLPLTTAPVLLTVLSDLHLHPFVQHPHFSSLFHLLHSIHPRLFGQVILAPISALPMHNSQHHGPMGRLILTLLQLRVIHALAVTVGVHT